MVPIPGTSAPEDRTQELSLEGRAGDRGGKAENGNLT